MQKTNKDPVTVIIKGIACNILDIYNLINSILYIYKQLIKNNCLPSTINKKYLKDLVFEQIKISDLPTLQGSSYPFKYKQEKISSYTIETHLRGKISPKSSRLALVVTRQLFNDDLSLVEHTPIEKAIYLTPTKDKQDITPEEKAWTDIQKNISQQLSN